MAVIVRVKNTEKNYILLGTGYGAYKAVTPSFLGGNLFPNEDEGTFPMAAVCDNNGDILWLNSDSLQVMEIDGVKILDINI